MTESGAVKPTPQAPADQPPVVPAVAAVTMVQAMVTLSAVAPATIAPEIARTLGVPAAMIGLQVSLAYAGAMAISFFAGRLVRRWGAVRCSQTACILAATGTALIAVPTLVTLALGSLIAGAAYGLTNPAASHLLMRLDVGRHRTLVFSIKQAGQPLGGVAAGVIAPPIAVFFGWQYALLTVSAFALVLLFLLSPLRRRHDDDRDPWIRLGGNPLRDLILVWQHQQLRPVAVAAMCFAAVQLSLTTFAVTMLVEEIRFGLVEAGIVLASLQVTGVGGRILWGWVTDRTGDGALILVLLAIGAGACGLAMGVLTPGTPALTIYALFVAFGATAVAWNGVFMAEIARLAPHGLVSGVTGAFMVMSFLGIMVGPSLFTTAHSWTGSFTTTFQIFAVGSFVGALVIGRSWWRRRRGGQS